MGNAGLFEPLEIFLAHWFSTSLICWIHYPPRDMHFQRWHAFQKGRTFTWTYSVKWMRYKRTYEEMLSDWMVCGTKYEWDVSFLVESEEEFRATYTPLLHLALAHNGNSTMSLFSLHTSNYLPWRNHSKGSLHTSKKWALWNLIAQTIVPAIETIFQSLHQNAQETKCSELPSKRRNFTKFSNALAVRPLPGETKWQTGYFYWS